MKTITCTAPQGSPEWLADRIGKATGSRAKDIRAKIKTGEAASRKNYRTQLVTERLTGTVQDSGFINDAMKWGIEQEPFARMAYETHTGLRVDEVGFIYLSDIAAGCSVDGLIGTDGMVEFKCPLPTTHIEWLTAGTIPSEHKAQILHNLWVTGRKWCDFVSYDPRFPENLQLLVVRYERNEAEIEEHASEVIQFLSEVDAMEDRLRKRAA